MWVYLPKSINYPSFLIFLVIWHCFSWYLKIKDSSYQGNTGKWFANHSQWTSDNTTSCILRSFLLHSFRLLLVTRSESRHTKSDDIYTCSTAAIASSVFATESHIKLNQLSALVVVGASIHPDAGRLSVRYKLQCLALSIMGLDHPVIPMCSTTAGHRYLRRRVTKTLNLPFIQWVCHKK